MIPAAPQETVGEPGSNPGLLRDSLVSARGLDHWATTFFILIIIQITEDVLMICINFFEHEIFLKYAENVENM
jgi:hypothetical protein